MINIARLVGRSQSITRTGNIQFPMPDLACYVDALQARGTSRAAVAIDEINKAMQHLGPLVRPPAVATIAGRIFGRAIVCILLMLVLSALLLNISPALTIASLCFTGTLVFMFAFALWLETKISTLNPTLIVYGILLTLGLAGVALASFIFH